MSIRPATESDHDVLRRLWEDFQAELEGPDFLTEAWDDAWRDLSRHVGEGLAFVSERDGDATGFVVATVPRELPQLCHVTDLYVVPDERRRGVARALMRTVLEAAQARGIGHVGLDVRLDNAAALAFYKRLGFAPWEYFLTAAVSTALERSSTEARPAAVGSLHVQSDDEAAVEHALTQFLPRIGGSERTEVFPPENGWIAIVDELCDRDRSAQRRVGTELSERLGVPVVAFAVEDDAVVRFLLFHTGRMVDEYLSVPTYYGELNKADELSLAANPTLVARLTGADPARLRAVARVASAPAELPPARELLAQIADVMGLKARIER